MVGLIILIFIYWFLWYIGSDHPNKIKNKKEIPKIKEEEIEIDEKKTEITEPYKSTENTKEYNKKVLKNTNDKKQEEHNFYKSTKYKKPLIDPKSPWGKLHKQVLERDKYTCQGYKCGSKKNLSVHHIVPVSLGGRNNLTNLVTLCLECHEKTHNNNFTSRKIKGDLKNYGNDVQLSKKIILLSDAIDNQKDVKIDYINFDKIISHRVIKPNSIAYGDHNLKIYVYAYCYMRKALRTFRISRMSNLKIVL